MTIPTVVRVPILLATVLSLTAVGPTQVSAIMPSAPTLAPAAIADRDGDGLRDAFESRWAVSDPDRADSDRDGLPDSAEDPDDDGLGNLGEQRAATDPSARDTDDDGRRDAKDDADGDGIADGLEQDARPIPDGLTPRLAKAFGDLPPSYGNGCHSGAYDPTIHPCAQGDRESRTTVVMFGDSHALQWQPALARAGATRSWRIVMITKSGCPAMDVRFAEPYFVGAARSCIAWRDHATAWLRVHPPELVIVSNSRGYALIDKTGSRLPWEDRSAAWAAGLRRTLADLPPSSRVLVLGDTPHHDGSPPICLAAHPARISACGTGRGHALASKLDAVMRATAHRAGATFETPNGLVCPYDPCPVIVGRILMWRDQSHLTATFARSLAPGIAAMVARSLHGEEPEVAGSARTATIAAVRASRQARRIADADGDGLRDAFERRWAATDPARRDSDGDGLRDPAEDPDGDHLGNLGEQRSRTSPIDPDSDGDGIRDGAEDADGDGRSNASEQDDRPIPRDLSPSLRTAAGDVSPSLRDGCHITASGTGFRACVYGDPDGRTTVALFGDSHAAQWLPGLIAAARWHDWRIVSLTRSGCPSADVITYNHAIDALDVPCARYREQALAWIRSHRPDIVLISNLDRYALHQADGDTTRRTGDCAGGSWA